MLKPREAVRSLKSYHPPLGNRQGLRLDFNENTVGCSPRVMQKLRTLDAEQLARYPEREPLEAVVASHLGFVRKNCCLPTERTKPSTSSAKPISSPATKPSLSSRRFPCTRFTRLRQAPKLSPCPLGKNSVFRWKMFSLTSTNARA